MAWTKKGREHEKEMKQMDIEAEALKKKNELVAKIEADRLHFANEEKERYAKERKEDKDRASRERIEKINAEATVEKAKINKQALQFECELKRNLAQLQVEADAKEQEEQTRRTFIEEKSKISRAQISADRDIAIAKSADETHVRIREQERLEKQFLESEITKRGEITLEYMKEQLRLLDKDRERKHLEFEKLIDTTSQKQRELQELFDKTGNIELIEQISDCETTLKQYIAKDKRDEKEYQANKLIMNENMDKLFISSDLGANE